MSAAGDLNCRKQVGTMTAEEDSETEAAESEVNSPSSTPNSEPGGKGRKTRSKKAFPNAAFEDVLELALAVQKLGAGNRVRRLDVFQELGRSPESGPSRQMVANSGKYGLTTGGVQAEYLELTPAGAKATDPDASLATTTKARFDCAIAGVPPFKFLYEKLSNNKLPSASVLKDLAEEGGVSRGDANECVDLFVVNVKYLGLLQAVAGAERVLTIEHRLEKIPGIKDAAEPIVTAQGAEAVSVTSSGEIETYDFSKICFYVAPIGEDDSEHRRHSDLFLNHIVEPALEGQGLTIVRADRISKPGLINAQIIEHVVRSKLVIADLSYHNPNVFYELSLRHACGLPTVQVIRKRDRIPFDLQQYRTIAIDDTDIYSLIPQLRIYQSEIATQVRSALENPISVDNPIRTYIPGLVVTVPPRGK
jgi:hypothetical protein